MATSLGYVYLSCVVTLSKMFSTMFEPKEISNFFKGSSVFPLDACGYNFKGRVGEKRSD